MEEKMDEMLREWDRALEVRSAVAGGGNSSLSRVSGGTPEIVVTPAPVKTPGDEE